MGFNTINPVELLDTVSGQGAGTVLSGTGGAPDNSPFLAVLVDVTAGTTPSVTATVEWSHDGVSFFGGDPTDVMTAIAAVGRKAKHFTRRAPSHRVSCAVTGTGVAYTVRTWCFGA